MSDTIQRGLFGDDYAPSSDRNTCYDDEDNYVCPSCGNAVDIDDCVENPDGELWCGECIDNSCTGCERCGSMAYDDDTVDVVTRTGRWNSRTTQTWCENCADDHSFECDDCGDHTDREDSYTTASGGDICGDCYNNSYFTCDDCGEIYHRDDCNISNSGCYCNECRPYGEDFYPGGFRNRSGRITEIGSARCFGVELETDECDGYYSLNGSDAWGAKDDCTVSGKEFYSDVLNGDEGLDAIREWGDLAERNRWYAGGSCGLHIHLDLRKDSDDQRFAIAYAYRATQEVWFRFANEHRQHGSYSHAIRWNLNDVISAERDGCSYYDWACDMDRYNWANVYAFSDHETIEIRLHQGTCDDDSVINWIKAHLRFADWAASKGLDGIQEALDGMDDADMFKLIANEAWQDEELEEYYRDRAYHNYSVQF